MSSMIVNELYDSFVAIFAEVVDKFAPMRKASRKEKKLKLKPWISNGLLKSIKIKNKMFKFLHKNKDDLALKERYKSYRNTLNRVIRQSKRNYYHKILEKNKGNSKTTWDVVNELVNHKSRNKSLPLKLKTSAGDTVAEDSQIIADEFNNFFVSIGKEMASSIQTCRSHVSSKIFSEEPLRASNSIFLAPSTETEVCGLINQIKSHKARRANDIESKFIKLANPVIANFLSEMFNLSLTTGIYPDAMKVTEVIPILKKVIVRKQQIIDQSHYFRSSTKYSKKCCTRGFIPLLRNSICLVKSNLVSGQIFLRIWRLVVFMMKLNEIDQNLYNCGIFLDLSKAFDTVNHNILANKLENYFGFRGRALELMKSYLTNRFQYTKIGNSKSKLLPIECGVPQGSSLGPLLFTLYINDLPLASKFSATLYADDTYLALSDKNLTQLETRVNDQLQFINAWLQSNKLSLNYTKTTYMLFNKHPHQAVGSNFKIILNQQDIIRSQSVTYLGLCFDEKLIWTEHINKLSLQLAKYGAMLYQIRDFVNQHTLSMLYSIMLLYVAECNMEFLFGELQLKPNYVK